MSSRSKGVMYCVLRSVISSRVIASPSVSSAFTCSCVTPEFGCSRKRRSTSRAVWSAFSPARANRLKNSSVRGVKRIFMGARHVNRMDSIGADRKRIAVSTACETTRERGPAAAGPRSSRS